MPSRDTRWVTGVIIGAVIALSLQIAGMRTDVVVWMISYAPSKWSSGRSSSVSVHWSGFTCRRRTRPTTEIPENLPGFGPCDGVGVLTGR